MDLFSFGIAKLAAQLGQFGIGVARYGFDAVDHFLQDRNPGLVEAGFDFIEAEAEPLGAMDRVQALDGGIIKTTDPAGLHGFKES